MSAIKFDHSAPEFFLTDAIRATMKEFAGRDKRALLCSAMFERHGILPSEVVRIEKQLGKEKGK
jgi:hypothetical protein